MFEPTTLPTAISVCLRIVATIEVASSGSEVPTATMVRPITASDMPKVRAIRVALSTRSRAPITSRTSPARVMPQACHCGIGRASISGSTLPVKRAMPRKTTSPASSSAPSARVIVPSASIHQTSAP